LLLQIIFITLFYGMFFPMTLLLGTIALLMNYIADMFLLTRRWKPVPQIGTNMVKRVSDDGDECGRTRE